jgi:hypothetical protein
MAIKISCPGIKLAFAKRSSFVDSVLDSCTIGGEMAWKRLTVRQLFCLIGLTWLFLILFACSWWEGDEEPTIAERLVGEWYADTTVGDLGDPTPSSGSIAGNGWTSYHLILKDDNSFQVTGTNVYDTPPYGDGDGVIHYSGTYSLDLTENPRWIDLTCLASDNLLFPTADSLQPMEQGIFRLSADDTELTIQFGFAAYGVSRPGDFLEHPTVLVRQQ